MSVEQARGLIQRVGTDPEFKERLESAPMDQKRAVLVEAGFGDLKLRHMSEALPESAGGEIPDAELEAVAGGSTQYESVVSAAASAAGSVVVSFGGTVAVVAAALV